MANVAAAAFGGAYFGELAFGGEPSALYVPVNYVLLGSYLPNIALRGYYLPTISKTGKYL